MLYVTHDQAEALALADRVAVMDGGKLVQLADPRTLYREPATEMVAGFIGKGAVVAAAVVDAHAGHATVDVLGARVGLRAPADAKPGAALVLLRPEALSLTAGDGIAAKVGRIIYQGAQNAVELAPAAAPDQTLHWLAPADQSPRPGDTLRLAVADGWVIPRR